MNKKGIGFFYVLMLGTVCIVLGLALASPTKEVVDDAMDTDQLNCTNPNISDFDAVTCIGVDILKFLVVGGLIFIGVALIGAKLVWG